MNRSSPLSILLLGSLTAFAPLSVDMYLPAFSKISNTFSVSESKVQLSLTSFFIGLAIGQLLYGPLTDRLGRKRPLYAGLFLYSAMSAGCALAPNMDWLIFFRFMQALGACGGVVIARAIVRDSFAPVDSARVFSMLMLIMGIAPILAPLVGGIVVQHSNWRNIFWIHSGLGLISLACSIVFLSETHRPDSDLKFRYVFQIYKGIIRNRVFLRYAISGSLAQAGMFAYITGASFVFIELFNLSAQYFGWIFGMNAFGLISASQINARLVCYYDLDTILNKTFKLIAALGVVLGITGVGQFGFWSVSILLFSYLAVLGMTYPNTTAKALASQKVNIGCASALLGAIQFCFAFLISIAVSQFQNHTVLPMTGAIAFCGVAGYLVYKSGRS